MFFISASIPNTCSIFIDCIQNINDIFSIARKSGPGIGLDIQHEFNVIQFWKSLLGNWNLVNGFCFWRYIINVEPFLELDGYFLFGLAGILMLFYYVKLSIISVYIDKKN